MVVLDALTVSNFKRYAGTHRIPLSPEEGTLTIVAAQNGVGKTSLIDALHVGLWGKRGYMARHPGEDRGRFDRWLANAFAVGAEEDYPHLRFAVDVSCPINGNIRIERVYWLLDGEITEEFGVTVDGKPVEVEEGERRSNVAARWVEALLPLAAMRRFIVDNERLDELDPQHVDQEMRAGLDDLMGLEVLHRLDGHLATLAKRADSTKEEGALAERLAALKASIAEITELITAGEASVERLEQEEKRLRTVLDEQTEDLRMATEGGSASSARVAFAEASAHMAAARAALADRVADTVPFLLMGIPEDLDLDWGLSRHERSLTARATMGAFRPRLEEVKRRAGLTEDDPAWAALDDAAEEVLMEGAAALVNSPAFAGFDLDTLGLIRSRHAQLDLGYAKSDVEHVVTQAQGRLDDVNRARGLLAKASEGFDISSLIELVEATSGELGRVQEECANEVLALREARIRREAMRAEEEVLNEALANLGGKSAVGLLLQLSSAIHHVMQLKHGELGVPLAEGFEKAFRSLSRKAELVDDISVDPSTYEVHVGMEGFDGNWLDRDLSATERQHVGLALTSALRGLSTRALPVVVDTPVSRMDREHKTWSVQRFYPNLAHQTIILATSDDLADGLYEELAETGAVGRAVEIRETGANHVQVIEANLATFFGGA